MSQQTYHYRICSHWNQLLSGANGETFDTEDEAIARVRYLVGDMAVTATFDDAHGMSTAFYANDEDKDADAEGAAPHLTLAVVCRAQVES